MKHEHSSRKHNKPPAGRIAQRARQISETAGPTQDPNLHHWLKAEAETTLQREREIAAQHTMRIDPADPG